MLELALKFTPEGGAPARAVTIRISDVRQTGESWSAQVDLLGFEPDYTTRVHGMDWPQAIELAARFIALECGSKRGTLEPAVFERAPLAMDEEEESTETGKGQ